MELTILGCSGSLPGPGAPAAGYLVEAAGFRLVLDFGNGTFAELQSRCDAFDIGGLLISHLHPDHCADVTALVVLRRYHPAPPYDPRQRRLPVFAPEEAPARFAAAYAPNEAELAQTDLSDVLDFHRLRPGTVHIGPFEVVVDQVAHPCQAYGFRIMHGGHTLVYTGDSGPCDALYRLADGADLLLSEATWTHHHSRPAELHLSGRQAGELAESAGVRRLLLTHIAPWFDSVEVLTEAKTVFGGDVTLAQQGTTYRVGW